MHLEIHQCTLHLGTPNLTTPFLSATFAFTSIRINLEIFESMTFDKKSGNRFCINRFSDAMVIIKQLNLSKNS